MDATNGEKLARLFELAGERGIPLVGLNDSAGAYIPAGVGGLTAMQKRLQGFAKSQALFPAYVHVRF